MEQKNNKNTLWEKIEKDLNGDLSFFKGFGERFQYNARFVPGREEYK